MLTTTGILLKEVGWLVKVLIWDGHQGHLFVRGCLHGDLAGIDATTLAEVPFFNELTYHELPRHALPRFPIKVCKHRGEVIWGLPAPCSLASVVQSHSITIYIDLSFLVCDFRVKPCKWHPESPGYVLSVSEPYYLRSRRQQHRWATEQST